MITIKKDNISVIEALQAIEKQSKMFVAYNESQLKNQKALNLDIDNKRVDDALNQILKGTGFTYQLKDNLIAIVPHQQANQKRINGTIIDENGDPIIGANIVERGTTNGTITDINGKFTLQVQENALLQISYIGYLGQNIAVKESTNFDIILQEDSQALDEIVVTALGLKRSEKALSYNLQQVTNEDLTTVKSANFINSLTGKVAGVQINSSAAGPGSAAKVVMRGAKSISLSNNALYVIDGVPMNNYTGGGSTGAYALQPDTESAADINPDDIESMSVLTGASAAALYGYEGANGVILITTKKGRAGKTSLSYSNNTTFSSALKMPEFQNTYGNIDNSPMSWGSPTSYRFEPRNFFNTGANVANTLSLSTGSEHNQSYFSISANNASGILPNNDYDRYNFTYRNTSSFLEDKFLLDAGVNYIIQKNTNMVSQGQYFNPLPALYLFPRGEDFRDVQLYERYDLSREVNTQFWPYGDQGLSLQNPYWIMNRMNRELDRKRYMLSATLTYNITDWLNIAGRVNIDNSSFRNTDKRNAGTLAIFAGPKGRYRFELRDERQTYADIIASIDKRINDFSFNINAGSSVKDRRMESHVTEGDLEKVTNWFTTENMGRATGVFKLEDNGLNRQTQSVFANAEIGYNDYLYLTLTGRSDWDSALAWSLSKERSFFYPSVGLSGLVSEMVSLPKWVTYLKARLAYTSVGNSYDPYLTKEFYIYDEQIDSYSLSRIRPNYNLRPEITDSYEAGFNMKFFNGALSLDATYYVSDTKNQTHQIIEAGDSYDGKLVQAGNVRNSGIELALGYSNKWRDFSWSSNSTFTYNKNKITRLLDDSEEYTGITKFDKATLGSIGSPVVRITEGGTMGDIYMTSDFKRDNNGYIYLDHATLLPSMVSLNPDEYVKLGSLLPKYNIGWRNSFSYKGVRLNVLLSGRFGGLVVSNTQAILDRYGVSKHSAALREAGGVTINGREISAQDFLNVTGEGTGKADYYVYKADNVRLQEISIEYTIPRRMLNNLADVTVGFVGNNLALLYCKAPFDPEVVASASSTYYTGVDYFMQPSLRNMGFSLKLQF
ncbi:MAG: SusC/RagA family TonB-linked outer membrane protein [Proteiniphilum sp.]|nr:SusC/RagA family TonB-linked outer membrane protein [Proteiniphilum sp.]